MKKILFTLAIVAIMQSLFVGVAGAQYVKQSDKTISINTGLNLYIPLKTGQTTFELQEAIHENLQSTSGLEVDHYYLWVEVDGNNVAGIDPIRAMY